MIDLFSVKVHGQYDEIGATPTIDSGLFLCDTTSENYVRGYSYQVITENDQKKTLRAEALLDYKITRAIYPTIHSVCEWLNNWFTIRRNYSDFWQGSYNYGTSGQWHDVPEFPPQNNSLCKVRKTMLWEYTSLYNVFFVSYVQVDNEGHITCDNPKFNPAENYFYYPMYIPEDVEDTISKMIYYDVYTRGEIDGLKSENIGNYSYQKEDVTVGTLAYPSELVAGIETSHKKVRFI